MSPRGRFVVVEGIDGSGSTTVVRRLGEVLAAEGRDARVTAEPSAGPVGLLIRQILAQQVSVADASGVSGTSWQTMSLLFAADRMDHVGAFVQPALRDGALVLSDRYDLSSLAYQSATSSAPDVVPWIRQLNRHALRPDLTLVLDVSPDEAERRRLLRGGRPELYERRELQRRLAAIYREAEQLVPGDRVVHIDADRDPDSVFAEALAAVRGAT